MQISLSTPQQVAELKAWYLETLLSNTLPFWFPRSVDQEYGGFLHCVDRDGSIVDSDKSVWAQGRMSWMLLSLFNTVEQRPEWLEWGRSGIDFIERHCFDTDGRMFFHVAADGTPIRKRRYAFSESFAAIAFAAWGRATNSEQAAERAKELYATYLDWNFTPGKMPPKFTGARPMVGIGPFMISIATAQELRDNLGPDSILNGRIDDAVESIERLFVKPELQVVMESVSPTGEILDHFDGRQLNPGHAIEAAWFILREADYRNDSAMRTLGCNMLDWMWKRGWDDEFGGLFYFRDVYDKPVQEYWHDMKFWWPHDEAIIATLLAWRLTGEERYARWHKMVHEWSYQHFADRKDGEWFGYLHRDGRLSVSLKGNLWKSFFHHPRMEWTCWKTL